MDENINYKQIALLNRAYMAEVWHKVNENADLTEEEELLAEQMQAHSEYSEVWENKDLGEHFFDLTKEENPFLHISLHVMLERQIRSNNPPYVRRAIERLAAQGEDPHDVQHAILRILVSEMWAVMTQRRPFNLKQYCDQIESL